MRDDQYLKLQALTEKLLDVAVVDIDPSNWVGHGIAPIEMTQQQRGDSYWCKKNAIATIGVIVRVETLLGKLQLRNAAPGNTPPPAEGNAEDSLRSELDREVADAEKVASKLLDRFQSAGRKATA